MGLGVSFGPRFLRTRVTARGVRTYGSVGLGPVSYGWTYSDSRSSRSRTRSTDYAPAEPEVRRAPAPVACRYCDKPGCLGLRHIPKVTSTPSPGVTASGWVIALGCLPFLVFGAGGIATIVALVLVIAL